MDPNWKYDTFVVIKYSFKGTDIRTSRFSDVTALSPPRTERKTPSLTGFEFDEEKQYICVTGDKSFEYYNIKSDMWYRGPSMIESRSYHSSCSIDEYLYAIGGQDKCLIEKVNVSKLIRGEYMTKWEPIDIQI